jgi:hypothetical protein
VRPRGHVLNAVPGVETSGEGHRGLTEDQGMSDTDTVALHSKVHIEYR